MTLKTKLTIHYTDPSNYTKLADKTAIFLFPLLTKHKFLWENHGIWKTNKTRARKHHGKRKDFGGKSVLSH